MEASPQQSPTRPRKVQGGDRWSLDSRDTCALPEGEEQRACAGVLPKCWDNPEHTAGRAEPGTSLVQRLRGSWSLAEAPVIEEKAGAARRVPGPIFALPPLPGTGGAARGRGVSRSQRSRPRWEILKNDRLPATGSRHFSPRPSIPGHRAEVEKWAPGHYWKQM